MWVSLYSHRRNTYFLVALLGLTALLAKYLFNGLIYDLDFSLFHPDGTLYTFRTLSWLGYSQNESGQLISGWYAQHAGKMTSINPESLYFDLNPNWHLYKFRLLYSFLSIPFVYLFGINGMLVIPALSYLGMLLVILEIGYLTNRVQLALILILSITISITITRWMFINTTDSLFTFLTSVSTYLFIKWKPSNKLFLCQIALIVLMITTRVTVFYAIPLIIMLYLKSKIQAISLFLLLALSTIPLFMENIQNTIGITNASGSIFDKVLSFSSNSARLITIEIGQLFVFDRVLLILFALSVYLALKNIHSDSSKFLFLSILSTYLMSVLNGTAGVNFRFQLSIIGALVWVVLEHLPKIRTSS